MSHYILRSSFIATLLGISLSFLNAQNASDLKNDLDSYKEILLDGKIAYLSSETKEILTFDEYQRLSNTTPSAFIDNGEDYTQFLISEDHWDTLKVNPFKGFKIEKPFLVNFSEDTYASPIDKKMVVTSHFGRRRRGPHRGIDIDLVTGDKVRTILPGKVRFVGYSSGHGRTVIVRHANDLETVYAHLSSYNVRTNDVVEKGQVLGKGGTSGNARGSHLHLEVRYKGVCINPEYLLEFNGSDKIRGQELWVTKGIIDPLHHSSLYRSNMEIMDDKDTAITYQKNERRIHVVKRGDTLWGIARKNGMQVKDIVAMNKRVSAKSTLRIGQHLVISP